MPATGSNHPRYKPELHIPRPCACGCGEMVMGAKDGKLKRFKQGHWARVNQPMKNPETRAKFIGCRNARWVEIGSRRQTTSRIGLHYWQIKKADCTWDYEHRYVMEQILGRKLDKHEHVHHLDGNTLNNEPSNLAIILHSDHSKVHCTFSNAPKRALVDGQVVCVGGV